MAGVCEEFDYAIPHGKHCVVIPHPCKKNRLLKVFTAYPQPNFRNLKSMYWGDRPKEKTDPDRSVRLIDGTKIQNICWLHNLAPRVYGIVKTVRSNRKFWAQEIEPAGGRYAKSMEEAKKIYAAVMELGKIYGFKNDREDVSKVDVMNGLLVDFNTFHPTPDFMDKTVKRALEELRYGKRIYHNFPPLGITGAPRNNEDRVKWMKLGEIDFKDKSVLDLSCASGWFCHYAKNRKADRVIGVDERGHGSKNPIKGAYLIANLLGHWDIDFYEHNLNKKLHESYRSDIVFCFSLNFHIGVPDWLSKVTKEVCVFEDNSKDRNAKPLLKKQFNSVVLVGHSSDRGEQGQRRMPIYWCKND